MQGEMGAKAADSPALQQANLKVLLNGISHCNFGEGE
jgi:hypothetical protein